MRTFLISCGILASLFYLAMNVFLPLLYEGYSSMSQTVSELSAIGAPTRRLWVILIIPYTLLMLAFGWAVWLEGEQNRPLRIVGGLIIANAIIGLFWPPMNMRGSEFMLTDAMHIIFAIITVIFFILEIGFGAAAFGKSFRVYSVATLVIFVIFGVLTAMDGPRIAANLPTPWVGVWERVNIAAYMLWIVVLAIILLRTKRSHDALEK